MTPTIDHIIDLIEQLDARVVTVEVATQRFDLDINELREMVKAVRDQQAALEKVLEERIQNGIVQAFQSEAFKAALIATYSDPAVAAAASRMTLREALRIVLSVINKKNAVGLVSAGVLLNQAIDLLKGWFL